MASAENAIRLTAKLYDARDYVRRMSTPERFREAMTEYAGYIRQAAAKYHLSEIQAAMRLCAEIEKRLPQWKVAIVQRTILAAYVEMIEPSE